MDEQLYELTIPSTRTLQTSGGFVARYARFCHTTTTASQGRLWLAICTFLWVCGFSVSNSLRTLCITIRHHYGTKDYSYISDSEYWDSTSLTSPTAQSNRLAYGKMGDSYVFGIGGKQ